jgi:opacity protein-like surface antigen
MCGLWDGRESIFMRKLTCLGVFLFLFAYAASAQIPTSGNVFFGYSFENASSTAFSSNLNFATRPNLQGWDASLEGKIAPMFGIVTDLSGHYGSQSYMIATPVGGGPGTLQVTGHEFNVLFGPRISVPLGKFTPFGEAMVGVGHMTTGGSGGGPSDYAFATALGGGIDYRLIRLVAVRLEGDYVTNRFFGAVQNNIRISTGIVIHF